MGVGVDQVPEEKLAGGAEADGAVEAAGSDVMRYAAFGGDVQKGQRLQGELQRLRGGVGLCVFHIGSHGYRE